jgi:hypothetical protein
VSKTRLKSALRSVGVLALAGLVLTGCGSSARPGVAVEVGDESISTSTVDSTSAHLCTALGDQFKSNGTVVPMGFIRQGVVQLLTLSSTAEQIADEYGVEPGQAYHREVAQREATAESFPEEVRADYVEVMSANALASDILNQVGRIELENQGVTDPTVDQITKAGTEIFSSWPDKNGGVEIDPRYGVEMSDGTLTPVDTNLSVAVGEDAKAGLATEPDATYANTLPETHRCG